MSSPVSDTGSFSIFSVDVEDGLNILMKDFFDIQILPTERVIRNVNCILDLCSAYDAKATFFILGEVAQTYPELVRTIAAGGHEIAVHGYNHDQIFRLSPAQFKNNLLRAKSLIEGITGEKVRGFRAPAFSIDLSTAWALEIISELGFEYDSSIMPSKTGRYGWPGFNRDIVRLNLKNGNSLIEVPLSVIDILGKSIPACGGGYLRYLPYNFTRKAFMAIQKDRPVVVYLHPYELDTKKYPYFFYEARSSVSIRKKLPLMLYRFNKGSVKPKLQHLLEEFRFKPIMDIVSEIEKRGSMKTRYL